MALEPMARANPASIRIVRAPGRVNLIGEHTDYNQGLVMPVAINLEIRIAYVPTNDTRVELTLAASGERDAFDLRDVGPPRGTWIDYAAGTAWALAAAGAAPVGLRGLVASTLPVGAGLASSAALELALAWALSGHGPPTLKAMALAQTCQRGENEYVGVRCGLMDQFASSLGETGAALLLDCRSFEYRSVPLPVDEVALVVCHSGSPRRLGSSEYNARRTECEQAVEQLSRLDPAVHSLRDVAPAMIDAVCGALDEKTVRRCRHVIAENERVLGAEAALHAGDLATLGRLFAESHASLRDLYQVSSPELDALVAIASATEGVVAARMTGAGFGGCTVNLVRRDAVERLRRAVLDQYPRKAGLQAAVYVVEPVAGAGVVEDR